MSPSFHPDDMNEGMLDDTWIRFTNSRFVGYDFEGQSDKGNVPCFAYDPKDPDNEDLVLRTQYLTCGSPDNWEASPDGKTLIGIGQAKKLSKASQFGKFMEQTLKAGFPPDLILDEDISFFDDVVAFMAQMPTGGTNQKTGKPSTKPMPTQFKLKDAGKKKGKAKGKSTSTTKADSNGSAEGVAEELADLILNEFKGAEDGFSVEKQAVTKIIRGQEKDTPWKKEAMKILIKDDSLKELCEANGLEFAGGKITVAG